MLKIFWEGFKTKYQGWFVAVIAVVAVGLWIAMSFVQVISQDLATGVSLSALVIILAMVIDHLVDLKKLRVAKLYSKQSDAEADTLQLIRREKVQLIEYSSKTIHPILRKLREVGAEIELLICNPNHSITNEHERQFHSPKSGTSDLQKEQRICPAVRELQKYIFEDYDKVKIKCYQVPGSLRARNFGNRWIQVGWYTYDTRGKSEVFGSPQIWGDQNPVTTAPVGSYEGQILRTMFDTVFNGMWKESLPLREVCGKCSNKINCFGSSIAADNWLQKVSPLESKTRNETKK